VGSQHFSEKKQQLGCLLDLKFEICLTKMLCVQPGEPEMKQVGKKRKALFENVPNLLHAAPT